MTDYERDYARWQNDQSFSGRFEPEPRRSDYDRFGYKIGSVTYHKGLILDNYLIKIYGMDYAIKNPLQRL